MTKMHDNPKTKPAGFVPREFRVYSDIVALSNQGKWWRSKDGRYIKVKDMHPAHRANAARMLERNAQYLADVYSCALTAHCYDAPDDVFDSAAHEGDQASSEPIKWIRGTAIYRALTADVVKPDLRTDDVLARLTAEVAHDRIVERIDDIPAARPA
jgi:hypothetical protein